MYADSSFGVKTIILGGIRTIAVEISRVIDPSSGEIGFRARAFCGYVPTCLRNDTLCGSAFESTEDAAIDRALRRLGYALKAKRA